MDTGYYETFNRENVTLVDIAETPVTRATATGLETTAGHHDLDVLVLATGFDAMTAHCCARPSPAGTAPPCGSTGRPGRAPTWG